MEKCPIFFPCSSTSSASPSSLNMANPQTFLLGDNANELKIDTKFHHLDAKNISESIEVRSGKKEYNKKMRRHKYAFQTRSQVDILDDGYRWRKYGQKTVKNNKFPRSYYKCTNKECNIKKQVQRSSIDEEIVLTTYEGMHTHPIGSSPRERQMHNNL